MWGESIHMPTRKKVKFACQAGWPPQWRHRGSTCSPRSAVEGTRGPQPAHPMCCLLALRQSAALGPLLHGKAAFQAKRKLCLACCTCHAAHAPLTKQAEMPPAQVYSTVLSLFFSTYCTVSSTNDRSAAGTAAAAAAVCCAMAAGSQGSVLSACSETSGGNGLEQGQGRL